MPSSNNARVLCIIGPVVVLIALFMVLRSSERFALQIVQINFGGEGIFKQTQVFRFASYYQDNMVLQAEPYRAVVWGYGSVGAQVRVALNDQKFYNTVVKEREDGVGVWSVTFDPQSPGTGGAISVTHQYLAVHVERSSILNIVFGDVWVCSGQSNMAFPMAQVYNASQELENVSKYSDIRIFTAAQEVSDIPLFDLKGVVQNWAQPTPDNVQYFSAVCWLFARNLYDRLKVPFGLVQADWGGTAVEAWSSPRALAACGLKSQEKRISSFPSLSDSGPEESSVLWNAMVYPLLSMTIKGVIWYQGERNAFYNRDLYNCTFPNMIKDWRRSWSEENNRQTKEMFPFGFVQLAPENIMENNFFPLIRWHQTADRGYAPNSAMPETFMTVAMDLPDPESPYGSIHPRDKQDVGFRLASAALSHVYKVGPAEDGPFPTTALSVIDSVVIIYTLDLNVRESVPSNFEVCCIGSKCDVSDTTSQGMSEWKPSNVADYAGNTVEISGASCPQGVQKVRYAWSTMPCDFKKCQIYNDKGFPGPPFVIDVEKPKKNFWPKVMKSSSQLDLII